MPRQIIGHCGPSIIAPLTSGSCNDPVLLLYDSSSEMVRKSHTTITIPTREARTRLLIWRLLICELTGPLWEQEKLKKFQSAWYHMLCFIL
ncbi:hypothetical protein AVEN_42701-1 [Araneus ventricosus]|uniref:Uncharacterized protein n=1 Tax=Araneus ventricosus TaxID=182803 RepID=A0A4Y2BMH1_ARAVE|nr:hypothetical protein AVEN_42701-1 [Araneus ventricosus]